MSSVIRLHNLPMNAGASDIRRFFHGLSIPDGGVRIVGGEKGLAFIAFNTDYDAKQAFMLNGCELMGFPVELYPSSKAEVQNVVAAARESSRRPRSPDELCDRSTVASSVIADDLRREETVIVRQDVETWPGRVSQFNENVNQNIVGQSQMNTGFTGFIPPPSAGPMHGSFVGYNPPVPNPVPALPSFSGNFNHVNVFNEPLGTGALQIPSQWETPGQFSTVHNFPRSGNGPFISQTDFAPPSHPFFASGVDTQNASGLINRSFDAGGQVPFGDHRDVRLTSQQNLGGQDQPSTVWRGLINDPNRSYVTSERTIGRGRPFVPVHHVAGRANHKNNIEVKLSNRTGFFSLNATQPGRVDRPIVDNQRSTDVRFNATSNLTKNNTNSNDGNRSNVHQDDLEECQDSGTEELHASNGDTQWKAPASRQAPAGRQAQVIAQESGDKERRVPPVGQNFDGFKAPPSSASSSKSVIGASGDRKRSPIDESPFFVRIMGLPSTFSDKEIRQCFTSCVISFIRIVYHCNAGVVYLKLKGDASLKSAKSYSDRLVEGKTISVEQCDEQEYSNPRSKLRQLAAGNSALLSSTNQTLQTNVNSSSKTFAMLKNLPSSVAEGDVRKFLCGIRISDDGGPFVELGSDGVPTGKAFVELHSEDDMSKALALNGKVLSAYAVSVVAISKDEFDGRMMNAKWEIEDETDLSPKRLRITQNSSELFVVLGNLPLDIDDDGVRKFLSRATITAKDGCIECGVDGKPTGNALVELKSLEDCKAVLTLDGRSLNGSIVTVIRIDKTEYDDRLKKSKPACDEPCAGDTHSETVVIADGDDSLSDMYVCVTGLPLAFDEQKLRQHFGSCKIARVKIMYDEAGVRNGTAYMKLSDEESLQAAVLYGGKFVLGKKISVERCCVQESTLADDDDDDQHDVAVKEERSDSPALLNASPEDFLELYAEISNIPSDMNESGMRSVLESFDISCVADPCTEVVEDGSQQSRKALVEFSTPNDLRNALLLNEKNAGSSDIAISVISKQEYDNRIEQVRNSTDASTAGGAEHGKESGYYVVATGLPSSFDYNRAFRPRRMAKTYTSVLAGNAGRAVYLHWAREEGFTSAMRYNGRYLDGKKISMKKSSAEEFNRHRIQVDEAHWRNRNISLRTPFDGYYKSFILMKNFPPDADGDDVLDFLERIRIPIYGGPFMEVDGDGKPTGDVMFELSTYESRRLALARHGLLAKDSLIYVCAIQSNEYYEKVKKARPASEIKRTSENVPACDVPGLCIHITGLPLSYSERTIRSRFMECRILELKLVTDESGKSLGVAFLRVGDEQSVRAAMSHNGKNKEAGGLSVKKCTVQEFENADTQRIPSADEQSTNKESNDNNRVAKDSIAKDRVGKDLVIKDCVAKDRVTKEPVNKHLQSIKSTASTNSNQNSLNPASNVSAKECSKFYAILKNLPSDVDECGVLKFLSGIQLATNGGPVLELNRSGERTGNALVKLRRAKDLSDALALNERLFQGSVVNVMPIDRKMYYHKLHRTKAEMKLAKTSHRAPGSDKSNNLSSKSKTSVSEKRLACVMVHGLPASAGSATVRKFFKGIEIAEHGVHVMHKALSHKKSSSGAHGKPSGIAYVQLTNLVEFRKALDRSRQLLEGRRVEIVPCSYEEMTKEVKRQEVRVKKKESKRRTTTDSRVNLSAVKVEEFVVIVHNLDVEVKVEDIVEFFSDLNPIADSVELRRTDGNATCDALVTFPSSMQAESAVAEYSEKSLGGRVATITHCNDDMERRMKRMQGALKTNNVYSTFGFTPQLKMGYAMVRLEPLSKELIQQYIVRKPPPPQKSDELLSLDNKLLYVTIRRLPASVKPGKIRTFFTGIDVAQQGIHIVRDPYIKPPGIAYVRFTDVAECRKAYKRDGRSIDGHVVDVIPGSCAVVMRRKKRKLVTSRNESNAQNSVETPCEPSSGTQIGDVSLVGGQVNESMDNSTGDEFTVLLQNLSFDVQLQDITDFFADLHPVSNSIRIRYEDGRPTGDGLVSFLSSAEAEQAVSEFNNKLLLNRPVTISPWVGRVIKLEVTDDV